MFQLLFTIALKFGICLYNVKKYSQQYIKNINKNIFNNFLITESRRTRTHLFQKLPSPAPAPAPAPESRNAPVLHSLRTTWHLYMSLSSPRKFIKACSWSFVFKHYLSFFFFFFPFSYFFPKKKIYFLNNKKNLNGTRLYVYFVRNCKRMNYDKVLFHVFFFLFDLFLIYL